MVKQNTPAEAGDAAMDTADPKDLRIRELELKLKASESERDALRVKLEQLQTKVTTLQATQVEPTEAESKLVLMTALDHNGKRYPAGSICPFDPRNPPPGCDGLVENVHFAERKF